MIEREDDVNLIWAELSRCLEHGFDQTQSLADAAKINRWDRYARRVVSEWEGEKGATPESLREVRKGLPRLSELVEKMASERLIGETTCLVVIRALLGEIYKVPPEQVEGYQFRSELIRAWAVTTRLLWRDGTDSPRLRASESVKWFLPTPKSVVNLLRPERESLPNVNRQEMDIEDRFAAVFNNVPVSVSKEMSWLGFATFDVLTAHLANTRLSESNVPIGSDALPLVLFLAHLIQGSAHNKASESTDQVLRMLINSGRLENVQGSLWRKRLQDVSRRALFVFAGSSEHVQASETDADKNLARLFVKKVSELRDIGSIGKTLELWDVVKRAYSSEVKVGDRVVTKSNIPEQIYHALVTSFTAMRRFQDAGSTWDHMVANGIVPSAKAWLSLLIGCKIARWPLGTERVLGAIRDANVKIDEHMYSVSIYTLLAYGRAEVGLQLLEKMTNDWIRSVQMKIDAEKAGMSADDIEEMPVPTQITLNAALSGIMLNRQMDKTGRDRTVKKLLDWGISLRLDPDVKTFNILMHAQVEANDISGMMAILERMAARGIEPDTHTFTSMSTLLFGPTCTVPAEELGGEVVSFIKQLESRGVKLTNRTFSTLVHCLLQHHRNARAAQEVLALMRIKAITPSVHLYTAVLSFHATQPVPDIDSIEALWNSALADGVPPDAILYSRIISLLANADQLGRCEILVQRCIQDGIRLGWIALRDLLASRARSGEHGRAGELVRDVIRQEGIGRWVTMEGAEQPGGGAGGSVGNSQDQLSARFGPIGTHQREFWDEARRNRLV